MKSTLSFLLLILFVASCGPNTQQAIDYNDAIMAKQHSLVKEVNKLEESFVNFNPGEMDKAYETALKQVDATKKQIAALAPFNNSTELKDAAAGLFEFYGTLLKKDYAEIIRLNKLPENQFSKAEEAKLKLIAKGIDTKLDSAVKVFTLQQEKFAAKYNFELEKTEKK